MNEMKNLKWILRVVNFYKSMVIICFLTISVLSGLPLTTVLASETTYLNDLIFKAKKLNLPQKRYWHVLLHYKPTIQGMESEIDSESFFLASNGRTDPLAELNATLSAFFEVGADKQETSARCRYPARFDWLNQHLNFDSKFLPVSSCSKLEKWLESIHPESLTLVFPGYYLQAPASMFGHTLLRVNSVPDHRSDLMAMAINYSAIIDPEETHPVEYIFKGVLGGFEGAFSAGPYYEKVKQYNDFEIRDIWEYDLNFSRTEIITLLKHFWELKAATFNYYFFKENCSYHLISLLEAARPSLNIQDSFQFWTLPADTLKRVIRSSNMLTHRRFRPSRQGKMQWVYQQLNRQEKSIAVEVIDKEQLDFTDAFKTLSAERKSLILDFLVEYYSLNRSEHEQHLRSKALLQRADLQVVLPDQGSPLPDSWPDQGHESSMVSLSAGTSDSLGKYMELSYRPVYHDLLDNDTGYIPNSQIEALYIKLRQGENYQPAFLEDLTLLKVVSLPPVTDLSLQPSWKLDTGIRQSGMQDCINCLDFEIKAGAGISLNIFDGTLYSLGELVYLNGDTKPGYGILRSGLNLGILVNLFSAVKFHLDTTRNFSDPSENRLNAYLAFNYFRNVGFRMHYRTRDEWQETGVRCLYYF